MTERDLIWEGIDEWRFDLWIEHLREQDFIERWNAGEFND